MPEEKNIATNEEIREIRAETEKLHKHTAKLLDEITEKQKESDRLIKNLTESCKHQNEQIGGYGNKFGDFTEAMAKPSIKRILDERFNADYRKGFSVNYLQEVGTLEVDAWGEARNGVKAAYIVEIKSRFKPKNIKQVLRQVEKFRKYVERYRDHAVYPVVAAVQISDKNRLRVWKAGMHLIDIADGVFSLAKPPSNFNPNGHHGLEGVRKEVPPLRLVRKTESENRKAAE